MTTDARPQWMRPEQADRALGALIGLAVGDALGTTLEFTARDQGPRVTEIVGGGPFGLAPGQWTDDTAMALALADSLVTKRRFDAHDLIGRFVSWWREGTYSCTGECFDIGGTVRSALHYFETTGNAFAGSDAPDTAGNGSIMRLAPAVLYGIRSLNLTVSVSRDQSRTTHGAAACLDACDGMARLMRALILRDQAAPPSYRLADWQPSDPGVAAALDGSRLDVPRDEVRSTGFVTATLHAALWAVARSSSFEEALVLAVNLGGDADTVGAVAGQIAGASFGLSAIPERWLAALAWRERLEHTAYDLLEAAPERSGLMSRLLGR